jgi:hypothetical protein
VCLILVFNINICTWQSKFWTSKMATGSYFELAKYTTKSKFWIAKWHLFYGRVVFCLFCKWMWILDIKMRGSNYFERTESCIFVWNYGKVSDGPKSAFNMNSFWDFRDLTVFTIVNYLKTSENYNYIYQICTQMYIYCRLANVGNRLNLASAKKSRN